MKRVAFVSAVVAAVVSTAGPASAAGSWTEETIPPREGNYSVFTTTASGAGTTWAFGGWYSGQPVFRSQAYRRGPAGWEEVAVPDIGRLDGSAVVSRDDAWAVGQDAKYGMAASVHWDGNRWTEVPLAAPPPKHRLFLHDVAAWGPEVWAVGALASDDPSIRSRGVVQHWDGSGWIEVAVPEVPVAWSLSDLAGTAPDDLWAVGRTEGEPGQGVAMHWDGRQWSRVPLPEIDGSPTQDVLLHGVAALAPNDVWASGTLRSYGDEESVPVLLHWDGTRWAQAKTPVRTGELGELVRVGDQLWVLGSTILRYDGSSWKREEGPSAGVPAEGTALDDGRLLTVGSTGTGNEQRSFVAVHSD